ncbi:MAG TPA: DUF4340 domain-containing protein [Gemmatimonadales bacterium]|nr:DUF4340 domain-containing protein [Gemmatimonadales bacterium]
MSPKILQRIALVLGVAVAVWALLALVHRSSRDRVQGLTLPHLDLAQADTISYVAPGDTVRLVRRDASDWLVNGYPAAAFQVKGFFSALADPGATSELVAETAASHARLGVDSLKGKHLLVSGGGKVLLDLWFGSRGPDFDGFYVRRAGSDPVYLLHGRFADLTAQDVAQWRERQILAVEPDSITGVTVTRGRTRYTLDRGPKAQWSFSGGGPADSTRVARFLVGFQDLQTSGFPTRAVEDSARFDHPARRVELFGGAGRPLANLAFDSTSAGFLVRADSGGPVYRLDSRLADELTPEAGGLKPK